MNNKKHHTAWIYFAILLIVTIQFIWVFGKYKTIESQKVFKWTLTYVLPLSIILGWIIREKATSTLFYSYSKKYNRESISKRNHLKNVIASYGLVVAIVCFFFYGSMIQTNDWFGTNENYTFNTEIISAKAVQHARYRSRRLFGASNISYEIEVEFKEKIICLKTETIYGKGDMFNKTLNTGGFWGIIYEE